ncbi:unnamed protein product [Symbiodinium natans]|uniref:Uncharacterized protein n=1 Tax=Symbiodinium natans TaxID=878477 RepID=A0A812KTH7_9DINO|nr:unnamed protein product [Symbiodinium natans]
MLMFQQCCCIKLPPSPVGLLPVSCSFSVGWLVDVISGEVGVTDHIRQVVTTLPTQGGSDCSAAPSGSDMQPSTASSLIGLARTSPMNSAWIKMEEFGLGTARETVLLLQAINRSFGTTTIQSEDTIWNPWRGERRIFVRHGTWRQRGHPGAAASC